MSYSKVYSGSFIEVQRVKQLLEQNGIHPIIKDTSQSALMAGFGAVLPDYQELFVRADEASSVLNFIKENIDS